MPTATRHTKVLIVNCGSSSIKFQLYDMPRRSVLVKGQIERIGEGDAELRYVAESKEERRAVGVSTHDDGMALILDVLVGRDGILSAASEIGAVGHRVVHGGEEFTRSVLITPSVIDSIDRFAVLAPLHNPANLTGIRAAIEKIPHAPQVACFDTAFHATIPEVAHLYALPYQWYQEHGVRRYGFHGASHQYVARRAAEIAGRSQSEFNCITAHLGNGCSITAVQCGRSIDTSMGLTPLEGLVMGTRSGDFDPAIVFHLAEQGFELADLKRMCNKESGLLGVSGESNDMRELLEKAHGGHRRSRLAIDVFAYRLKKYIGMYSAVLGRVDAVVFTGGIGENASEVRSAACNGLERFGIRIDENKNREMVRGREGAIGSSDGGVEVFVIPTDEEAAMASDTYEIFLRLP